MSIYGVTAVVPDAHCVSTIDELPRYTGVLDIQQPFFRIGAVSYLNTLPLVWGMLHGHQRSQVNLTFSIPSVCACEVEQGTTQIGLVPVAEIARQGLEMLPGLGIACFGPVRSILLFSRVPFHHIQTLSADLSSRTSVELARVILRERFGAEPRINSSEPILESMLAVSDAALIIGDPALRTKPEELPFECLDLGAEWLALTGLPMVFAAWAGKPGLPVEALDHLTRASYDFGRASIPQIVQTEAIPRGVSPVLAEKYLRHHIRHELGPQENAGLRSFLTLANLKTVAAEQS